MEGREKLKKISDEKVCTFKIWHLSRCKCVCVFVCEHTVINALPSIIKRGGEREKRRVGPFSFFFFGFRLKITTTDTIYM